MVGEFYERVLAVSLLAPVFSGVDMANLWRHQALFISQVLGGSKEYYGRTLYQAHRVMMVTGAQFDAVAGHLQATLEFLHVDAPDIDTILGEVAPLGRYIVMTHFKRWLRGG